MVASWPELRLDKDFLTDHLARGSEEGRHYSSNRLHATRDDFVIYTNLGIDLESMKTQCLHSVQGEEGDRSEGPTFDLAGFTMEPSYSLAKKFTGTGRNGRMVEVVVTIACKGRSFQADVANVRGGRLKAQVTLTAFSFSSSAPAKSTTQVHNKCVCFSHGQRR